MSRRDATGIKKHEALTVYGQVHADFVGAHVESE